MKQISKLCFFLILIICINLSCLRGQEQINLNFNNTNLEDFIKIVAKKTNKRILYDASIKNKKIYLVSASTVSSDALYKIFLSVMEYNGYILETTGRKNSQIIKVKRNVQAPWTPTDTIHNPKDLNDIKNVDHFITMVTKLNYISAREVETTLRALRIVNPQGGHLAGIEGSNTILITDFAPNVKRVYDVIKMMDQPGPEKKFKIIKLNYAIAEEVVKKLKDFTKTTKTTNYRMGPNLEEAQLMADSRLNAVIIQAYEEKMKKIVTLVRDLDQKLFEEPSSIHYVRLKHADATKLQKTLTELLKGGGITKKAIGSTGKTASTKESISTSIQAEPQTNSLIVHAEKQDWREIKNIIEQVDVRRPQVLIEGALIEISPEDVFGLGVELFWAESPDDDHVTFGGGSNFGFSNLVTVDKNGDATVIDGDTDEVNDADKIGKLPLTSPNNLSKGISGFMNYKDIFTMPIFLKAFKQNGDFKIVSIPSVLTNDNEMAEIKVADAAPSRTSTENNSGSRTDSFDGFQEAGTTLIITPHISGEKNYLRLEVSQSIDEFDTSQNTVGGVPPKRVRTIKTTITVPNSSTVAIGGFTFDSESETIEKVPFLGDLPVLGMLFQTRIVTHKKRNIYLFITPRILREKSFSDLHNLSYEYKLKAHQEGADLSKVDKDFVNYQKKYGKNNGALSPVFMMGYESSQENKKENKKNNK